jgi:hypothetical protein
MKTPDTNTNPTPKRTTTLKQETLTHVIFIDRENGPKNLITEAEVHFTGGLFDGMKLTGFSLWRTDKGAPTVTLPARAWGESGERKFFDLLRAGDGGVEAVRALKAAIVAEYERQQRTPVVGMGEGL